MTSRTEKISALTPLQALAIMQYMTASLSEQRVDEQEFNTGEQVEVLNAVFQEAGYPAILSATAEVKENDAGQAAQQFLMLLAEADDAPLLAELDDWLAEPPEASIQAIPLVLAIPIVLTGCIVALQTGVVIERDKAGKWKTRIEKRPLAGKTLAEIVSGLFTVVKVTSGYPEAS
jgi:hypothetical protein